MHKLKIISLTTTIAIIIAVFILFPITLVFGLDNASLNGDYWAVRYSYESNQYIHSSSNSHQCALSTITFDGNGNFSISKAYSEENLGANQTYTGTGTYTVNPDGTVNLAGSDFTLKIQEGGKLLIGTDVNVTGHWRIDIVIKKPSISNFNNSSLNGDYWQVGYSYESTNGHQCSLGDVTFYGDGNYSILQTYSEENTGANQTYTGNGTYSVDPNGTVNFDNGLKGKIQEGGNLIIATDITRTDKWGIDIILKKPSNINFTNSSVNGDHWIAQYTYATQSYPNTTGHDCSIGTIIADGKGNYTVSTRYNEEAEGPNQPFTGAGTYTVTQDGTINVDNGLIGKIQEGGDLIIYTDVDSTDRWIIAISAKKSEPIVNIVNNGETDDSNGSCFISTTHGRF